MAGFTTLGWLTLAATGISVYGQVRAGQSAARAGVAEREASESVGELSDYNAAVAELQADDALARGAEEESRFRMGVRTLIGSQRAGFAGGNIDAGFGSALDVQADAAFLGELDALTIRTNAAREAWGFKVEAEDLRRRGEIARKEGVYLEAAGRERRTQSFLGAGSSLLGSGVSMLESRYGFKSSRNSRIPKIGYLNVGTGGF